MPKVIVNLNITESIADLVDTLTEIADALSTYDDPYNMMYSAIDYYNGDVLRAINTLRGCQGLYDSTDDYVYSELDKLYKEDKAYNDFRVNEVIDTKAYARDLAKRNNLVFIRHINKVIVAVEK